MATPLQPKNWDLIDINGGQAVEIGDNVPCETFNAPIEMAKYSADKSDTTLTNVVNYQTTTTARVNELEQLIGTKQGTTVYVSGIAQATVDLDTKTVIYNRLSPDPLLNWGHPNGLISLNEAVTYNIPLTANIGKFKYLNFYFDNKYQGASIKLDLTYHGNDYNLPIDYYSSQGAFARDTKATSFDRAIFVAIVGINEEKTVLNFVGQSSQNPLETLRIYKIEGVIQYESSNKI